MELAAGAGALSGYAGDGFFLCAGRTCFNRRSFARQLGKLDAVSGLLLLAYRPVREAARYYPVSLQGAQALRDANTLLKEWEAFPKRAAPSLSKGNALALQNVDFDYAKGGKGQGQRPSAVKVFRNFSAEFPMGEVTGITGPNGAGKTTLLRLLAGAEVPVNGPVDGRVLWPEALRASLRAGFGGVSYLPQRIAPGSAWTEWAKATLIQNPSLWKELNSLLGLDKFLKSAHPEALSGGERQRMALARALSSNAPFLMMDEPTTALPGDEREHILERALNLWTRPFGPEGIKRGALIVSHEPFLAAVCDQMFALNGEEHAIRSEPKSVGE